MSAVPDGTESIVKGARYEWPGELAPLGVVDCVVNRVADDGSWADFTMTRGGSSWGKRMALPLPETFRRVTGGLTLGRITAEVREVNIAKGWRSPEGGAADNTFGDYIALLHSEVSEALEAYRDHRLADATGEFGGGECSCAMSEASMNNCPVHGSDARIKPEGVGSEFADILIRLVDMADVWEIPLVPVPRTPDAIEAGRLTELGQIESFTEWHDYSEPASFGDWMAWLHFRIVEMDLSRDYATPYMLRALVTAARHFGIDLDAEYRRKIAYNRTRPYQHGGRTLADTDVTTPGTVAVEVGNGQRYLLNSLRDAMPTDPRGWWIGEEIDIFLTQWAILGLPRLTMTDGQGETVLLWCKDVRRAAEMLGLGGHVTNENGFNIRRGEYVASIVQVGE